MISLIQIVFIHWNKWSSACQAMRNDMASNILTCVGHTSHRLPQSFYLYIFSTFLFLASFVVIFTRGLTDIYLSYKQTKQYFENYFSAFRRKTLEKICKFFQNLCSVQNAPISRQIPRGVPTNSMGLDTSSTTSFLTTAI